MQFPHFIILITNFPASKGINSQIPNTKPNLSYRKAVSKAEFCSQINHSNGRWTHKKGPSIWTEFKGSAGSVSQEIPVRGRKGQEKPLQSDPDQSALPCWQIWLHKGQPLSPKFRLQKSSLDLWNESQFIDQMPLDPSDFQIITITLST